MNLNTLPKQPLLLHVCCAPCSGPIISSLLDNDFHPAILFYNPNIFPEQEYLLRKASVANYASKCGLNLIDADYNNPQWISLTNEFRDEPERGKRCSRCFDMRLDYTAKYAFINNFKVFATTIGISRHKNIDQVNASGRLAAKKFPGTDFLDINWRDNANLKGLKQITDSEGFYKQEYCGCIHSLDLRNALRKGRNLPLLWK